MKYTIIFILIYRGLYILTYILFFLYIYIRYRAVGNELFISCRIGKLSRQWGAGKSKTIERDAGTDSRRFINFLIQNNR